MKNEIIEPDQEHLSIVKEYKEKGMTSPDFFPLTPYQLVQTGYPVPTKGVMIARPYGGTNKEGQLIDGTSNVDEEMWCRVSDVKKLLESLKRSDRI